MLGAALTTVLFLSLIGFTLRRTNVLETSLVFVYVVVSRNTIWIVWVTDRQYSAWLSGVEAEME
jgi:hypothetical protein